MCYREELDYVYKKIYFDDTEKWMIYVSHEGTISFTGNKIVKIADEVFGGLMRFDKKSGIFRLEHEVVKQCGISKERFHKVSGNQWGNIYQKIVEKYADKTKTWKNGLHWANTNGYSPKSMKKFQGCYAVDYSTWFYFLPQIIKEENKMVYFLIDKGRDLYEGEEFWIFESYVPELVNALDLLNHTAFFDNGSLDYYIVSKKYQWIIGFNHHDTISCIGEGLNLDCFKNH